MEIRDRILELIKARTPLFYFGCLEIQPAQEVLNWCASQAGAETRIYSLATYTLVTGNKKENLDPLEVLQTILKRKNEGFLQGKPILWVLSFFHLLLGQPDPLIISRLREVIEFSTFSNLVVILGAPGMDLPRELADIPVLDYSFADVPALDSSLGKNLSDLEKEEVKKVCVGMSLRERENLLAVSLARSGKIDLEILRDLRNEWLANRAGKVLTLEKTGEGLAGIGGLDPLKKWLAIRKYGFLQPELIRKRGLPLPKGVLLTGVPGCGKSLVCKEVAGEWNLPLFRFDPSRIYASSLGESETRVKQALDFAVRAAPCLLWVDEMEKGLAFTDSRTDGGVSNRIMGAWLHFLEERSAPVFIMATANDPTTLPPELVRKGRWDEVFFIDLPHPEEREKIFELALSKIDANLMVEAEWVRASRDYSGAEIHRAVEEALYESLFRGVALSSLGIMKALRDTRPLAALLCSKIQDLRLWGNLHARPASAAVNQATAPRRTSGMLQRGKG